MILVLKLYKFLSPLKKYHICMLFAFGSVGKSVLFQGSQELMELDVVWMLTLFESECKSGAAKRQFTFEISVLIVCSGCICGFMHFCCKGQKGE